MERLEAELDRMGFVSDHLTLIQEKDGVLVARVSGARRRGEQHSAGVPCVLKHFENRQYRREIRNYRLLAALHVPTLAVYADTESSLLMEDILASPVYRLGEERDLSDPEAARKIARWYRLLHRRGRDCPRENLADFYEETDCLTQEAIRTIQQKTETTALPIWRLIENHLEQIRQAVDRHPKTITYNDFYYTNLVIARDRGSALMFDYNLMGKGYAYADIRNVCSSLSPEAGAAFLSEYGPFDPLEKQTDDVVSVLVTLHNACRRETFPAWAVPSREALSTGYINDVHRLLDNL